jgi:hypothetical protein
VSFINKALEKAKTLHHKKVEPEPPAGQGRPQVPFPDLEEMAGFGETPGEIHYTYTRKIAVNMELLRHHTFNCAWERQELVGSL